MDTWMMWRGGAAVLLGAVVLAGGCVDQMRRTALERVAKGWCETIRASQVIPVYPLTSDLRPGDVFLVQTPIGTQADVYQRRGFLALDDHRTRLAAPGYDGVYFDGYFKDPFNDPPMDYPSRRAEFFTGRDAAERARASLSAAAAPRAAFPTYTFEVSSGASGAMALPIQGVPVGLNFLNTQKASGTVTIADARTYAGDEGTLYAGLVEWAGEPETRRILAETARVSSAPVYLRVVSRVYLTGAVVVSLARASAGGAGVDVGMAPDVPPITDPGHDAVLEALNERPDPVSDLAQAGGAVRFVAASDSMVTLAESFDTLLVIGYLGFDVPVRDGGELGAPIPTFERLEGRVPARADFDSADRRLHTQLFALEGMVRSERAEPVRDAGQIMVAVSHAMGEAFNEAAVLAGAALAEPEETRAERMLEAFEAFDAAAREYVGDDLEGPRRTTLFSDMFEDEFWKQVQ